MKEVRAWIILTLILYVIQSSLLPFLSYRGVSANLLLLLVTSFAFLKGARTGVFMGFSAGLLQYLATGTFFGIDMISYMLIAMICGKLSGSIFKDSFFLPIFSSTITAAVHYCVWLLFILMLGYKIPIEENIRYTLPVMVAMQFLFSYPVHKLAFNIDKKYLYNKYSGTSQRRNSNNTDNN